MSTPELIGVLTTIQSPTACVQRLAEVLAGCDAPLLVMGDRKGPRRFDLPGAEFYSLQRQQRLPFALARRLPTGHYARKNLGYLLAIARGARCIYETDDDNRPAATWRPRSFDTAAEVVAPRPWMNVYAAFSDQYVWPRGLPLECAADPATRSHAPSGPARQVGAPIQQGLADLAPDVDAVWRLLLDRELYFRPGPSLLLPPGTWCPFNSQTTWWWPTAYPLLYLPSHASFRMTDIWRSFVAQRCLWELGHGLVFHGPEVIQQRNPHNPMVDFKDELAGYLHNQQIVRDLEALALRPGAGATSDNLVRCYECLTAGGFLPEEELVLVRAWVEDLERIEGHRSVGRLAQCAREWRFPPAEEAHVSAAQTATSSALADGRVAPVATPCAVAQDDL